MTMPVSGTFSPESSARGLARNWWAIAIRGVVAILFGLAALFMPGLTLLALILLFAAWAIVDGIFALVSGFRRGGGSVDWLLVAGGIAGIVAGILAIVWPGVTAIVLVALIAAWALVTGAAEVWAAYRYRRILRHEVLLAADGILSVILGVLLVLFPGTGALALVWAIGAVAIVSGIVLLILAFRLRSRQKELDERRFGAGSTVS
jgi:uncharacterized membrane protein HdeD (DUF308 family)